MDRLSPNAAFLLTLRDSGVRFVATDLPKADEMRGRPMTPKAPEGLLARTTTVAVEIARFIVSYPDLDGHIGSQRHFSRVAAGARLRRGLAVRYRLRQLEKGSASVRLQRATMRTKNSVAMHCDHSGGRHCHSLIPSILTSGFVFANGAPSWV